MKSNKSGKDYYNLFMDGKWVESKAGNFSEVINPANEQTIAYVTDASKEDVEYALTSSKNAQPAWEKLGAFKRSEYIVALMEKLSEKKEHFAKILTKEQGKTYTDALEEVDSTIAYMKYAVEYASHIKGDILETYDEDVRLMIEKVPYGVTVGLCAWNYPLALVGRKLAPALVTGNTMIIKPHELTPVATVEFMKLVEEVDIPAGVVNLITGNGPEVGSQLVSSPIVQLVTVTGSVRAGQAIYKTASPNITQLSLELGGKAPFVVLEDADLEKAADEAIIARYANCGQICICCDMIFVQQSIKEKFTQMLIERAKKIVVGDPFDEKTDMGPKASKQDLDKIHNIVTETLAQRATLELGGKKLTDGQFKKGYWYPPTILSDVKPDMKAATDEIFGPVLPIISVKDYDEAVSITNSSWYGLAAYLFTKDSSKILSAYRDFKVGTIFINQGITGYTNGYHNGHKLSGLGGEDGQYGLDSYMQKRTIYLNTK